MRFSLRRTVRYLGPSLVIASLSTALFSGIRFAGTGNRHDHRGVFGLYIVGRVEFFEQLRPYFFTTDMDFWRDVFKPDIPWQSLWHYACVLRRVYDRLIVDHPWLSSSGRIL
mgnify:CR=1 FL=1